MSKILDSAVLTFDSLFPNYHSEMIQWTPKGATESQPAVKIIRYQGDKGLFLSTSMCIAAIKGMAEIHSCAEMYQPNGPTAAKTPATTGEDTRSLTDIITGLREAGLTDAQVKKFAKEYATKALVK